MQELPLGGQYTPTAGVPLSQKLGSCLANTVVVAGASRLRRSAKEWRAKRSMNEVVHTSPTIGSNVEEIVINNTRFLMWDIGGQESLRSSWNTYYTNTEFVIVVVDSTDRERISVTREELYKMLAHEEDTISNEKKKLFICWPCLLYNFDTSQIGSVSESSKKNDLRKAGLLIFANKQDVKECMTVAEISQFLKLTSIKDHQWHIQACCALTGEGLCQGLEWMMSRLKLR
ncbi:ADP-ribosylation factor-like protein 5A [Myotis davidii]|uniref:ADP-ribosylation factor-like protein 5A n=1 Tax=Myotis davidii TaxID=225400 RepID=L5M8X5_MYODS|nr:ADP-ribosylation factor-like protein 5A [Myotis davidii]